MSRTHHRRSLLTRVPLASVFGFILLSAPLTKVGGQTAPMPAESTVWRAWAFARLGGASSAPVAVATSGAGVLVSDAGGVAASYGMVLGMVRSTNSEQLFYGPGVRDHAAMIGLRSRGDHLFVAGAAGIDRATAFETYDDAGGTVNGRAQTTFAYDLSAHADYQVVGLAFAIAGVAGPQKTSYVAVTLGAELGWFGP